MSTNEFDIPEEIIGLFKGLEFSVVFLLRATKWAAGL
jgi:hypothetical protein